MESANNVETESGNYMTIGRLARRAGVTPYTVRYYEQIGIMAAHNRAPNGFRKYSDRDLYALRLVRRAKLLGLSLAEIKEMAPTLWEDPTEKKLIEKSIEVFTKHREKTEKKIKELEDYRALLTKEIARLKGLL